MKAQQFFALVLSIASSTYVALAATYSLTDSISGNQFYSAFDWQAIADPTHGRVNYVDQATSRSQNLTYAFGNRFILRADYQRVLPASGPGRNSVRIRSKKKYSRHVAIFDVHHMPQGCGTWPAIWEVEEAGWPAGGEVDIVEGVHGQSPNAAALHTLPGCSMPASRGMTGTAIQSDCNWLVNGNTGCNVKFPTANSFGPAFNSNGGGWFALERTNTDIKVWFWARNNPTLPADIRNAAAQVSPDAWGAPAAHYPNTNCDLTKYFSPHNIIINLTLCGDWAGGVYGSSGCPSTCVDYVNNNPRAFQEAYFDLGGIRVYT